MKRLFHIPIAIIVLMTVLTIGAHAQTTTQQRVIAKIPFTFTVGGKNLPAGKYTFTVLNSSSDRKVLQIRSQDGRESVLIPTSSILGDVSENAKLVFERYDDRYFFAQAQMAGDSTRLAAVRSKSDRSRKQAVETAKKKSMVVITVG